MFNYLLNLVLFCFVLSEKSVDFLRTPVKFTHLAFTLCQALF